MKKKSIFLLVAMVLPCLQMFAFTPVAEFADHTKVMKLTGGGEYKHKVIVLENPDSTLTIAVISDPMNQITRESLRINQCETFPYRDQLIYGNRYKIIDTDKDFEYRKVATIINGLDDAYSSEELTDNAIISTKEWTCAKNDAVYTLNAGGSGTVKYTISSSGYAQQAYDSRAIGSNQYRSRYKNQYYGGITGGYEFVVDMTFSSKVEWFTRKTKDGVFLVVNQAGNPSVVSTKISTSLDDDSSRKEWLKNDTKYNYDVNRAKESLMNRRPATFHGVVKAYKNQLIWLDNDLMFTSIKKRNLLNSWDNVEERIQEYYKNEASNWKLIQIVIWKYKHLNMVPEILEEIIAAQSGDYVNDFKSKEKKWNDHWLYYKGWDDWANITSTNIAENTNLTSKLTFVDSVSIKDIKIDSIVISRSSIGGDTVLYYDVMGLFTCHFYTTNSLGYQTILESDLYVVRANKFGHYEYFGANSLRVSIPEEPVFAKFDKDTYKKYNINLTQNHEDNRARIDRMLEYQRLLLIGINEYDSTIALHKKAIDASATIPDVNKAYTKYFKSRKLIWEVGQPEINLANEREMMSCCVAFCIERDKIAKNHQKIQEGYAKYKNILKTYNTIFKGLNLTWNPGDNTDKLIEVESIQDTFIRAMSTENLTEKDNAVKNNKDKSLNAILNILK